MCVCLRTRVYLHTPRMKWAMHMPDFPLAWDEASLGGVFTNVESKIARKASLAAKKNKNKNKTQRGTASVIPLFRTQLYYFEVKTICILIEARKEKMAV